MLQYVYVYVYALLYYLYFSTWLISLLIGKGDMLPVGNGDWGE